MDDPIKAKLIVDDTEKRTHHLEYGNPLGTFLVGDEDVIMNFAKECLTWCLLGHL